MQDREAPEPIGHSRLARFLWIFWALFILYGSTAPFQFVGDRTFVMTKLTDVALNPLSRGVIDDAVANVLLFVPFGCFLAMALAPRRMSARLWLATGLAALFSATVETLQLFTVDRLSSIDDVMANTLGALAGALVARRVLDLCGRWTGRLTTSGANAPALYPAMIAGVLICVAAWQPFDFTGDVTGVNSVFVHKMRAIESDPWQMSVPTGVGPQFLRFALFTLLVSWTLGQLGLRASGTIAAVAGGFAGLALTASQFVVDSRMPGLAAASASVAGAIAGALLSRIVARRGSPMFWCVLLGIATWIGSALQTLSPFTPWGAHRVYIWYRSHSVEAFSQVIDVALIYFPLGFALALVARARYWMAPVVTALAVSGSIESLHAWLDGRPNVNDLAIAVAGSVLGAWIGGSGRERFQSYVSSAAVTLR